MRSLSIKISGLILCTLVSSGMVLAQTAFKLPAYEKFKLNNGLTVYLMEQHEVPLISVSAILPAGAINDGDQHGLAAFTARGLKFGTKSYSKTQIEEKLDFIGATLQAQALKEYTYLGARFAAKDLDEVLPIFGEVITAPTFPVVEFDKEKKLQLASLDRNKQTPRAVIGSYWDHFIYGDQPYGNSITGSPVTVGKLTAADLNAFYKANYSPQGSAIAIAGDFNSAALKSKLNKLFAAWKGNGAKKMVQPATLSKPTEAKVLLVNKEDARETTIYIGGPGIQRNNPDYIAVDVINTLFGGRFTSMVNDELRVNSGLTYGASSRFAAYKNSGTFYITTFTAKKTTAPTLEKAVAVINKLHTTGIDEKSLASAKNYVKGQFPPNYETSSQLANLLTQMFWYDFDESFINNFQSNVDKLDLAQAKAIIAKYFPKDKLQFVLIGNAAEVKPIAEKYGVVTEKQIKDDGF